MLLRDRMTHRGPDGAGVWDGGHAILGHRRLAVIDLSDAGAQPFGDGTSRLVYNGELYNDAEVRRELAAAGVEFRTLSDTETVLRALEVWGVAALARLRGMFALGWVRGARLLIARDPLGVKPLYWRRDVRRGRAEVAFASEPAVLAGMGERGPRPDLVAVSAYLTTIRTTLGERTLYESVKTLRPGQWMEFDLSRAELPVRTGEIPWAKGAGMDVRGTIAESVARHLRSDVPTCCLLSGGLDSTIVTALAAARTPNLRTYCSGAENPRDERDDFYHARLASAAIGTRHAEAPVTRELFVDRWRGMVGRMGMPLSTPNEVAINEVARRLRADGCIVTLSGEGADELFGGYDTPMSATERFIRGEWVTDEPCRPRGMGDGGIFRLHEAAWVPLSAKGAILNEAITRATGGDAELIDGYRADFERCGGGSDMESHLRFMRRVNLAGLLQRLDTATMLEGVEGRTPFSDVAVAALAERLPMSEKFDSAADPPGKRCLRRAFAGDVPGEVLKRPKASFPLPFDQWMGDVAGVLRKSELARECFTEAAIETVIAKPAELWRLAWPMLNIALWGQAVWGAEESAAALAGYQRA